MVGRCRRRQQIDPLGIKPLYYANPGQTLVFSSELRAILSTDMLPRHLDQAGVAGLLAYGAVQQPNTIVQGIWMMPPGHFATWQLSGQAAVKPTMFWGYPTPSTDSAEPDAVDTVRRLLEQSVREHMVADVPVGVCSNVAYRIRKSLRKQYIPACRNAPPNPPSR